MTNKRSIAGGSSSSSSLTEISRHQRYRQYRKQHQQELEQLIPLLRDKIMRATVYLALIAQATLLKPGRYVEYRTNMLGYYADLFEYGVDIDDPSRCKKQSEFIRYHTAPENVLESYEPKRQLKSTIQAYLMPIWEVYAVLHEKFEAKLQSIACIDPDEMEFILTQRTKMSVTHRSIQFLLPHMVHKYKFMQKFTGKRLTFELKHHVTFDQMNRIVYLNLQDHMTEGWCTLVKDSSLSEEVLSQIETIDPRFIDMSYNWIRAIKR